MGEARHSRVKVHLTTYVSSCLDAVAARQGKRVGELLDEWLMDLPADVEGLIRTGRSLPAVSTDQELVTLRVTATARGRLNEQAARLAVFTADESVSARRLVRWLIEERLQTLGEL